MATQEQTLNHSYSDNTASLAYQHHAPERFLRFPETIEITGLSRGSIYKQIAAGTFPKNVPLGGRATGFVASEVAAWMEQRLAARDVAKSGGAA